MEERAVEIGDHGAVVADPRRSARRLAALESICGAEGSRLVLRVERKDRQAAARFVSRVHLALSEHRLGDLDA